MSVLLISIVKAFAGAVFRAVVVATVCWQKLLLAFDASQDLSSALPLWILVPLDVMSGVLRSVRQFQIFQSVVGLVLVFVVNQLAFEKRSAQMLAHHKAVLGDISDVALFERVWMIRPQQVNVSIVRNKPATFPSRIAAASMCMTRDVANVVASLETIERSPAWFKRLPASALAVDGCHARIIDDPQDGGNI